MTQWLRTSALLAGVLLPALGKNPRDLPADNAGTLGGPVLGFVFDADRGALRPVQGLPGAALLSAPLDLGVALSRAAVSPAQNAALGVAADDGRVLLVQPQAASTRVLDGVAPSPDQVVFSPRGAAAALFHQDTGQVEVLSGLPDNPALGAKLDLSSCPGTLTALAVADDAGALLAAFSDGDAASVFAVTADAGPRLVYAMHHASAIAFIGGSRDALLADDLDSKVWLARDVTGSDAVTLLAGPEDGIAAPAAVRASPDGTRAFVANSQPGSITSIGLDDPQIATVSCGCAPAALQALEGGAVLRLTEPAQDAPLWLLDTRSGNVFFVPAGGKAVQQ